MKFYEPDFYRHIKVYKLILVMKLIVILMVVGFLQVNAKSFGQKVTLAETDTNIEKVFNKIRRQTGYNILCPADLLSEIARVTINVKNESLDLVLKQCFQGQQIGYSIYKDMIIVKREALKDVSVEGRVVDKSGNPLPGVTVKVKGTAVAVGTNDQGRYSITVPEGSVLVFSFVGFVTQEVAVKVSTTINVQLLEDQQLLSQVVVVSYGTQKRRELTGSVATLKADELKNMPVFNISQQLQGKMAGVQVNQSTGQPGKSLDIRIRGAMSFKGQASPLYIVDGQPLAPAVSGNGTGGISSINPEDIESFTVLKDAASSALYGSRAANGVVLITTKRAKAGETQIDFNSFYGLQVLPQHGRPDLMNGTEFATFMQQYYQDEKPGVPMPVEYQNPEQYGEGYNHYDILFRNAPIQRYALSVFSGKEKSSTNVTAGYSEMAGVLKNTNAKLFNLRINSDFTLLNDNAKIGFSVAPSYKIDHNARLNTDNTRQIISGALLSTPLQPDVNPDGSFAPVPTSPNMLNSGVNWYRYLMETKDDYKTTRILGNAYGELNLLKGLKFKTQLGVDMGGETRNNFIPSTSVASKLAVGRYSATNNSVWSIDNTLNYQTTLSEDHHLDILVGYSAQKFNQEHGLVEGNTFPSDDYPWLNQALVKPANLNYSGTMDWSINSLMGRLNYNYKGKYLLQASLRRDGSSVFGPDKKIGYFPGISAGWIISDEHFFKTVPAISYLKLRASYGVTGNNDLGADFYSWQAQTGTFNYVFNNTLVSGRSISTLQNNQLAWEQTKTFDVGIDMNLFNERISFTYDYYSKLTDGLLFDQPIPDNSGFSSIVANIASVKLWGHEFGINTRNLIGDFKWNTSFNVSFNRNKVTELVTPGFLGGRTTAFDDYWSTEVGHPLGMFYGYVYDGVFMNDAELAAGPREASSLIGTVRMKDLNGDGIITFADRTFIGNPNPKALFGFTNDFSYKQFDLSMVMSGELGRDMIDGSIAYTENLDGVFNVSKILANRWRSVDNPGDGIIPRTRNTPLARAVNSRFVQNGSYLTCKNIALGYTIPVSKMKYLKDIRLFGSVQQAFVITSYKGMSPETSISGLRGWQLGVDKTAYPVPRTFAFGVNIKLK